MNVGRIQKVPLREVWKHEARSFSAWLAENVDLLGEVVGLRLSLIEREARAGSFLADILAEDERGNTVVIENQLEGTDHNHLGKIISYMSNLEAKTAIWITTKPRTEHVRAVEWINRISPADTAIYLLKVEAIRIEDPPPAALFTVAAAPSDEQKDIQKTVKDLAERHKLRKAFWEQLLQRAKGRLSLHERISPGIENWISAGAGKSGITYNYVVRMHDAQVEVYIDGGEDSYNESVFDQLFARKEQIEQCFGSPLEWQRLEGKRACRIRCIVADRGLRDTDQWEEIQDKMIEAMARLERAFREPIAELKVR